ncbi:MAG: hypothetical protein H8D34_19915 [Chloroflexi bacterium]|nr:hypothetical protein [Chloroflexota bacterium]
MNIYYTAKDIEELAAKGIQQLELGPGASLTDFAKVTAQQFDITLIEGGKQQVLPVTSPPSPRKVTVPSDKYNKPTGCLHTTSSFPVAHSKTAFPSDNSIEGAGSSTVKRLVDLMDKVIKRGG